MGDGRSEGTGLRFDQYRGRKERTRDNLFRTPDLTLLDLHMADMDGFSVVRELRSDRQPRGSAL